MGIISEAVRQSVAPSRDTAPAEHRVSVADAVRAAASGGELERPLESPSELASFGRSAARSAVPTAAGILGGIGSGALAGTVTANPIGIAIGAIGGGVTAAMGAGAAQEAAVDAFVDDRREFLGGAFDQQTILRDLEMNPVATTAGEVAPALATFNPVRGAQGVARAVGTAKQLATTTGREAFRTLPKIEQQTLASNLKNVAVGTGVEVGVEGAQQALVGEFDPLRLAAAGAAGSTLNEPTRLGQRFGLRGTVDGLTDARADTGQTPDSVPFVPQTQPTDAAADRQATVNRATVDLGEVAPDPRAVMDARNGEDDIALPDRATAIAEQAEARNRIESDRQGRADDTLEQLADAGGTSRTREQIVAQQQEARHRIDDQLKRERLSRRIDTLTDEQRAHARERAQANIEQAIVDAEDAARADARRLERVDDDVDLVRADEVVPGQADASGRVRADLNQPGRPEVEDVRQRTRSQIRALDESGLRDELFLAGVKTPKGAKQSDLANLLERHVLGDASDARSSVQLHGTIFPGLPQAVAKLERAVATGVTFARPHLRAAGQWLATRGRRAYSSVTAATRALVKRFGEAIRRHVPRIYRWFRDNIVLDERGAISAASVLGKRGARLAEAIGEKIVGSPRRAPVDPSPPKGSPEPTPGNSSNNVADGAKQAAEAARTLAGKAFDSTLAYHSEPLVDFVTRKGKDSARGLSERAKRAIDDTKRLFGELSVKGEFDSAIDLVRKNTAATKWLNTVGASGTSNLRLALEGDIKVPAHAREAFEAVKKSNRAIGDMAERHIEGFAATGAMQRMPTFFLLDLIKQGKTGRHFDALVGAFAKANPDTGRDRIVSLLADIKASIDGNDFSAAARKINQERTRAFRQVPSVIELPGVTGKRTRWLFHDRAADYLYTAAQRTTHRIGFLREFGQDQDATRKLIDSAKAEMASHEAVVVDDLVRALHGMPQDFGRVGSGSHSIHMLNRFLSDLFAPVALSGSAVVNLVELMTGQTQRLLGYGDYLKAAKLWFGTSNAEFRKSLEEMGAINRAIFDWSGDPASPLRTRLRQFRNAATIASGNNYLNELQEGLAAATANIKAQRMASGDIIGRERSNLRRLLTDMGFEDDLAKRMVAGDAEQADYDRFVRRASAFLTGGNKSLAENSRFAGNRLASALVRFQSYPIVQAQTMLRPAQRLLAAHKAGDKAATNAAAGDLAKQLGFVTATGIAINMVKALFTDGKDGLDILANEAEDEPVEFLGSAFLQGVGGPFAIAYWAMSRGADDGTYPDSIARATFPGGVALELSDALGAHGPYKGRSIGERSAMYLERTPIGRIASTMMGSVAFGRPTAADRAAIRSYWRWARDVGKSRVSVAGGSEADQAWRANMRRAADAILAGRDPSGHLRAALDIKGDDKNAARSIRQSLLARRLLTTLKDDERESLRKRIGQRAYDRLVAHDERLEKWANALK